MNTPKEVTFLKIQDVCQKTRLAKSSAYELAQKDEFPRPIRIGARASVWAAHEIEAWNRAKLAGASKEQIRALVSDLEASRKELAA